MTLNERLNKCFQLLFSTMELPKDDFKREDISEWDSMKQIELMVTIEEEFDIRLDPEKFSEADSYVKILKYIEECN